MRRYKYSYPFTAVIGQEAEKKALLIAAVNPRVSGVILSGEKGTAKSTIVRGLSELLCDIPFFEMPLNITEDRLVGSIDIEKAISTGTLSPDKGILQAANKGIIYVDEINLLSEHIANILLQTHGNGENPVEREGLSLKCKSSFVLIGSMNPEEGPLRPQLLDRFGLYVNVCGERVLEQRCEIIRRRIEYENDPVEFCKKWMYETERLQRRLKTARALVKTVKICDRDIRFAAELSKEGCCNGHRAEIILCEASKAIAALEGREAVNAEDMKEAAGYVLPHRLRQPVSIDEFVEDIYNESENFSIDETEETQKRQDKYRTEVQNDVVPPRTGLDEKDPGEAGSMYAGCDESTFPQLADMLKSSDEIQEIEKNEESIKIKIKPINEKKYRGSGKRLRVKSHAAKGRYVRYRIPGAKTRDIALDATLRAAALHPCELNDMVVQVKPCDIREKIREERTGATILFLVDASGSMGARRRMGAVKGAVLSMLTDAYQKRDTVGIVSFRDDRAELILNFTRSVDLAEKALREIKTGGKTPLAAGLIKAFELLKTDRIKNPDALQYLIVVSDGRANAAINSKLAFMEAEKAAHRIAAEKIKCLILDTESGFMRFGKAEDLAKALNGEYMRLNEISKTAINRSVKEFLGV
ncbi:MAG: VWA domain-containing protein [Eubacterium sp.]|nr:VWA domain-containing protein [Eubacterium sp.]